MVAAEFTLECPAFAEGTAIPSVNSCDGSNLSPFLAWHNPPGAARSFALMMDDPDAPRGTFTHWLLYDIPADARELSAGDKETGLAGQNDFQGEGYGGPCPPPTHGAHRYFFRLFALDVDSLGVRPGANRN